jgi:hypothetical protein
VKRCRRFDAPRAEDIEAQGKIAAKEHVPDAAAPKAAPISPEHP